MAAELLYTVREGVDIEERMVRLDEDGRKRIIIDFDYYDLNKLELGFDEARAVRDGLTRALAEAGEDQ